MTAIKITPGPWIAELEANSGRPHVFSEHSMVCDLERSESEKANAHLIAAAPDLLEAVVKLFTSGAICDEEKSDEIIEAVALANAALAKARGEKNG